MELPTPQRNSWLRSVETRDVNDTSADGDAPPRSGMGAVPKFGEGIAAKFALIFSLLVLIATGTVGFMVYRGAERALIAASTDQLKHTAEVVEVRLAASTEAISKDLRFLAATPPVRGTVRAHLEGRRSDRTYIDPKTYIDDQEWLDQLANTLAVFLENRRSYMRASFVVLAEGARELVRVEKRNERVHRAPEAALDVELEQDLFREAADLPAGASYLSSIMRRPESPATEAIPSIRAVTPVYASNGNVYGFITISVDARDVLDTIKSLTDANLSVYLANEQGQFLNRPRAGGLRDTFPQVAAWFEDPSNNGLVTRLHHGTEAAQIAYFERLPFGEESAHHHVVAGITSPYDTILSRVARVRTRSLVITLLFGLAGIALALAFSSYLTYPLRRITRALSRFGNDGAEPVELPVYRQDEIGVLARSFDAMTRQIQEQLRELAEKEHRQRIILETSAEGIIVITADGVIETSNRTAEHLFGYENGALKGRSVEQLLAHVDSQNGDGSRLWLPPWKQIGSGREVTGKRKDGTLVPLSLAVSAFKLSGEQRYAIFLEDISERKRYERVLQQAKEKAEEVARLKSTFLANMSHEIRTPLTTVIGYAGVLAKEAADQHRQFAEYIKRSGERLMDTLNSVLSLAQLEANGVDIQLDVLAVTEEAREIVQLFQPVAQEDHLALEFIPPAEAEDVFARLDSGALSSILQNLVGNALKFTNEGSVTVQVTAESDTVYLHVRDTGVGMDADFLPHLFDEFVQESTGVGRSHEGSGLGLSITKRLVRMMNGQITVESEKGEGTVFTVAFPRVDAPSSRGNRAVLGQSEAAAYVDRSCRQLLLAEDNADTASLVADILCEGYEVTVVSTADDAVRRAQEDAYDLILLDINLDGEGSGVDALHRLRTQPAYQQAPIAAVTAYALPGDRERLLQLGFDAYLSKPFTPEDLDALIANLLATA